MSTPGIHEGSNNIIYDNYQIHGLFSIHPKNMAVVRKDYTFANWTNAAMQYGRAADCYTTHANGLARCGTKGRFTVDLRGTGLAVVPEVSM